MPRCIYFDRVFTWIMDDNYLEYGECEICGEDGFVTKTHFVFDSVDCKCCEGKHYETVRHHKTCESYIPETISFKSKTGVDMIDIESKFFIYIDGN
jgi:hypothetical protein